MFYQSDTFKKHSSFTFTNKFDNCAIFPIMSKYKLYLTAFFVDNIYTFIDKCYKTIARLPSKILFSYTSYPIHYY